jgi:hypothetical protein
MQRQFVRVGAAVVAVERRRAEKRSERGVGRCMVRG